MANRKVYQRFHDDKKVEGTDLAAPSQVYATPRVETGQQQG